MTSTFAPAYGLPDVPEDVFDARGVCAYCGNLGSTRDHLRPRTWTGDAARPLVQTVPACQECNSSLGTDYFDTFRARMARIEKVYRRKYARYIVPETDEWSDEALAKLGRGLRERMKATRFKQRVIRYRLEYLQRMGPADA